MVNFFVKKLFEMSRERTRSSILNVFCTMQNYYLKFSYWSVLTLKSLGKLAHLSASRSSHRNRSMTQLKPLLRMKYGRCGQ